MSASQQAPPPAYAYPPLALLNEPKGGGTGDAKAELAESSQRLIDTLQSFGVDAQIINIVRGPTVTRFELTIQRGVKFSRITALSDDIALSLGAVSVRIAPIPDKVAIGIEVPNKATTTVFIREVIGSRAFQGAKSRLSFAVGKDITGAAVIGDIAKMPHMLIAGTTGSGKSVCINSMLISLLYKSTPEEVRLIMVDPKMVELGNYNGIPHLLIPVVTDPKKASGALNWAVGEMERRYKLFADNQVRNLTGYNDLMRHKKAEAEQVEGGAPEQYAVLPQIVIVIDELADLMMVAAKEVETSICRIAQKARAAGMHLVVATQRPSADVITGIMKANIPSRVAFAVASQIESRIILDTTGAEKLIGKGDMLYAPLGEGKPQRVQGCFISNDEIEAVIAKVKESATAEYSEEILEHIEKQAESGASAGGGGGDPGEDEDELLMDAIDVVMDCRQASVSMLQRRLKLGYSRAARIVDQMEERGIVGPFEGSKPRQLLISKEEWQEMKLRRTI
ncbi:DNA translocase FtsK [Intestinibacillus massiliensis]|nr:DNA translocase FtsK [Intestinibacillus massiliensis]